MKPEMTAVEVKIDELMKIGSTTEVLSRESNYDESDTDWEDE